MSAAAGQTGTRLKYEEKCSICRSAARAEIERCLWLMKKSLPMVDGIIPTKAWLAQNAKALWGLNLPSTTIAGHLGPARGPTVAATSLTGRPWLPAKRRWHGATCRLRSQASRFRRWR